MASAHDERIAAIQNAANVVNAGGYNLNTINGGYDQALAALSGGYDQAQDYVKQGLGALTPWLNEGQSALSMLGNAYGLNGAGGNAAAQGAFQASPGYQYSVDQATQNAMRQQSAMGQLGSGNTTQAVTTLAQNLANQDWNQWLSGLSGLSNQGQNAANTTLGGYEQLGNLSAARGTGLSNLDVGRSGALVNNMDWITGGLTGNNTMQAQASDSAANANSNLLMGLAGMPLQLLGLNMGGSVSPTGQAISGGTLGGSLLSSLGRGASGIASIL